MLEVQKYLLSGHTVAELQDWLKLKVAYSKSLPLMILDYSQTDSPKSHPIVEECRGLTLHTQTFEVVSKLMNRFHEYGQLADRMKRFDWSSCIGWDKKDGSLFRLFHFADRWMIGTRFSFGDHPVDATGITWEELFLKATGFPNLQIFERVLDPQKGYAFELCSLHNKVVQTYEYPRAFLLSVFKGGLELSDEEADKAAALIDVPRPTKYIFRNIGEADAHNSQMSSFDPTYEGLVLKDKNNERWKRHTETYQALHRMMGGDGVDKTNPYIPRNLLPFVMTGRREFIVAQHPSAAEYFDKAQKKVDQAFKNLYLTWQECHAIKDQKTFAQAVTERTRFSGILFRLRREKGDAQTTEDLKKAWMESEDLILKVVF
ncbi:MAG: hypothetical protein HY226_01160 [Candidatus Vogelbacteria bacterium]|nr:hypothetical protein [Candidatus Vogelbacteria bacterium]